MANKMRPSLQSPEKTPQARAAENIFFELRAKILSRELVRGNKLPTEKELTAVYGVSISTVRQAMRALAMSHFVEVRQGSGAYVMVDNFYLLVTYQFSIHCKRMSSATSE
jgi:DNA-binding FadR family transcriptional regulator